MIPEDQLDFAACVSSGQVFRFREEGDVWRGVDGDNLIEARRVQGGWIVESAPDENAWQNFFQIEVDLPTIQRDLIRLEPRLAPIIAQMPGLRTLRPQSPEETLISFLCTQNNHMSRIVKMTAYLAGRGEQLAKGHHRFPELRQVASLTEGALRAAGFGYRAATIPRAAAEIAERGSGWLSCLRAAPYEEARKELMQLSGVGPKLADCVCLFGLHMDAAVPVDTHIWKACVDWYLPEAAGKGITPKLYDQARLAFTARFGSLAGWAQQYVFYDRFLSYRRA